jgi:deoxyribodipyrimidine photo-lyase
VALEVQRFDSDTQAQEEFLEELIVRRELTDNFCLYNEQYDSFDGFPNWARATLDEHRADPRAYLYSRDDFESGQTHDDLWNAAQGQMVATGRMHGYMRMYWAKKILEWTVSPEVALETAIYLNNKYQLDGNDPNGYVGVAWSIGGVHDRPWFERDIFGKVRYMSYDGCRRKFDVDQYIRRIN